jgi:hypothetical protein
MKSPQVQIELDSLLAELSETETATVSGGQMGRSYCVYGPNGAVGVHDWTAMQSRPLRPGESCGG